MAQYGGMPILLEGTDSEPRDVRDDDESDVEKETMTKAFRASRGTVANSRGSLIGKMSSSSVEGGEPGQQMSENEGKDATESKSGQSQNRPKLKVNSTSTLYISSTISVPNADEIILAISAVIQQYIDQDVGSSAESKNKEIEGMEVFEETYYLTAQASARRGVRPPPSLQAIFCYLSRIFSLAQFSPECNIIGLVFVNRLLSYTGVKLTPSNWRPVVLSALCLAQKVWDDSCLANIDFPKLWNDAVYEADQKLLNVKAFNRMERRLLELLQYNVTVKSSVYTNYYFELRALCDSIDPNRSEKQFALKPLTKYESLRLEARGESMNKALIDKYGMRGGSHSAKSTGDVRVRKSGRLVLS